MSPPLVPTDALRAAVSKTVKNVLKVSVIIAVLAGVVAYIFAGSLAGLSGLIGGVVGILLALVTWFTMAQAMKNLDSQAALMVGDYLFKVVVVIATVLIVKNLTGFNHTALGLALILSVIAQAGAQTWTLASSKVPTIDLPKEEKE